MNQKSNRRWPAFSGRFCAIIAGAVLVVPSGYAQQGLSDPGPHAVGWRDVRIQDHNYGRGSVDGRIYYPAIQDGRDTLADPSAGPFPLVGMMHGWTEPASDYDRLCTHLASWGFVVMSNDTETAALFVSMRRQSADTRALMQWVEDESQGGGWLSGMTAGLPWSIMGHSMGGGSVSYFTRDEPRAECAVLLQPYSGILFGGTSSGYTSFRSFPGSVLVIGADQDLTNNWLLVVRPWYSQADSSQRRFWALVRGGDHFGSTDFAGTNGSLSGGEQHAVHRSLVLGFLRSEVLQEEDSMLPYWDTPHTDKEVDAPLTGLALRSDPASPLEVEVGSISIDGWRLRVAASLGTGSTQTRFGEIGIDLGRAQTVVDQPVGGDGWTSLFLAIPSSYAGSTIWIQALAQSGKEGSLSRVIPVMVP
ncbi:MAG: alpha/beta hydrolase [Planctomycetes bacterium]|nr:alpha/beta hydrolase [Planctomycetota bacterium]